MSAAQFRKSTSDALGKHIQIRARHADKPIPVIAALIRTSFELTANRVS